MQAPQTAQEPFAAPPAVQEPAEAFEVRQEPRAYNQPREPEQPKKVLTFDGFVGVRRTGLEMIALQSERSPQMLDIQLRAGTEDAWGRQVLSLGRTEGRDHGYRAYPESTLRNLERAAGDNRAEVEGGHVLGFRANVIYNEKRDLWLPTRFGSSRLEPVTQDTMRQQVEAQREAREQGLVSRSRQARRQLDQQRRQTIEISRDHDRGYGLGD
ncbi:hypothetical protein [Brevibacterium luteolum]|uniref:hypothetical protein n=1 Tax=Brevibacterium luteolum TaxID=199591 RepID=UPI00223B8B23|nr:hypothetical protein [Brevibacterium luteolum]MCT1873766.1 hypothetical protein [Brevibacterium luteolum]MCT1891006.1 hypothetical protein [Brevibacterium luteolum]MCT1924498.1 hypothetical protein [Brevibacterium luteolum]